MTGLTPVSRVAFQSWTAPAIEPWSVRLTAGISNSAARATRSGIRQAPSRIEYSEWTWRWTNSDGGIAEGQCTPGLGGHLEPACRSRGGGRGLFCADAQGGRRRDSGSRVRPRGPRRVWADAERRLRRIALDGHVHRDVLLLLV